MQNTFMTAPTVKEQSTVYYDWADGKAGMTDARDIVDAAVGVLTSGDEYAGQSVRLTGPESIGWADVARLLSDALGKEVSYVAVPHEAAAEAMLGMGMPEWVVAGYGELSEGFAEGYADTTTDGVERLAGHPPRSYAAFAREHRSAFE
jgi:uncharacterized protein YbjT (DUF2867 family)